MPAPRGEVREQGNVSRGIVDVKVVLKGCNGVGGIVLAADTNVLPLRFGHLGEGKVADLRSI